MQFVNKDLNNCKINTIKGYSMNKIIFFLIISIGLSAATHASSQIEPNQKRSTKPINENKIKRMDHKLTKHKAVKRTFKTKKEFQNHTTHKRNSRKITGHPSARYSHYRNGYAHHDTYYRDEYRPVRQRGYRHFKRGWFLAYRYDRADFYDNEGYYYGYFNQYGYYFEDIFYRYDRYYTYSDRVRGRGLFDHRFYMPANDQYYGFCTSHYNNRDHYRR